MAEGWLKHLAGERFDVLSAGIAPKGLHPHAVEVMREVALIFRGSNQSMFESFSAYRSAT